MEGPEYLRRLAFGARSDPNGRPAGRPLFRPQLFGTLAFCDSQTPGDITVSKRGSKTHFRLYFLRDFRTCKNGNFFRHFFAKFRIFANFRKNLADSWPFFQPGKIGPPLPGLGPRTTSRAGFGFRSLNRPNLGCWRPEKRTGGFGLKCPTDRLIKTIPRSPPFLPAGRPLLRTRFYFFAICKPPGT